MKCAPSLVIITVVLSEILLQNCNLCKNTLYPCKCVEKECVRTDNS